MKTRAKPLRRPRRPRRVIAKRVDAWLKARKQHQRWLAEIVGVTPAYIAMILLGDRTPSLAVAKKLQDLTGIPATDFLKPTRAA